MTYGLDMSTITTDPLGPFTSIKPESNTCPAQNKLAANVLGKPS